MSVEAEMSVIGCMMLDEGCAKEAIDKLAPEMFSKPTLKKIFETATDLFWAGDKVDSVTLITKLPTYSETLVRLAEYVPTWSHLNEYMKIVIDDWRRSTLETALAETMTENKYKSADETVDRLKEIIKQQDAIFKCEEDNGVNFREAAQQFMDWLHTNQEDVTIRTGYSRLDNAMGGFLKKSVCALCARAGHGKTDFALNLAVNIAKRGKKVQYFSMEMPTLQLMQRIASQFAHIDGTKIRDKNLTQEESETIEIVLDSFEKEGIFNFVDEAKLSVKQIRHYVDLFKPDIIFIDHIGLLERPNMKDSYRSLGMVSNEIKKLALEKNIAIVELSQMNRQIENRKEKIPNLADIRESGDIEQDSDYVMFVQSDDLENNQLSGEAWADTTIHLLKNRHGRPGKFQFHWQPQFHTFYEVEDRY